MGDLYSSCNVTNFKMLHCAKNLTNNNVADKFNSLRSRHANVKAVQRRVFRRR